jgi:hypothetical protein
MARSSAGWSGTKMASDWTLAQLLAKLEELRAKVEQARAAWPLDASEDERRDFAELERELSSIEIAVALLEQARETDH